MTKYRINNPRLDELRAEDAFDLQDEIALVRMQIEQAIKDNDRVGAIALTHALTSLCRTNVQTAEFSANYLPRDEAQRYVQAIVQIVYEALGFLPDETRNKTIDGILSRLDRADQKRIEQ